MNSGQEVADATGVANAYGKKAVKPENVWTRKSVEMVGMEGDDCSYRNN
jgi:hypothetical protein